MRYAEISPPMRQFLGMFEAYRSMGFSADDIFCAGYASLELGGKLGLYAVLRTQGREFKVFCGPAESEEKVNEEYTRVSTAVSTHQVHQKDLDRIWQESHAFERKVDLMMALRAKGFRIPAMAMGSQGAN